MLTDLRNKEEEVKHKLAFKHSFPSLKEKYENLKKSTLKQLMNLGQQQRDMVTAVISNYDHKINQVERE